jgi:hypothetical protein
MGFGQPDSRTVPPAAGLALVFSETRTLDIGDACSESAGSREVITILRRCVGDGCKSAIAAPIELLLAARKGGVR